MEIIVPQTPKRYRLTLEDIEELQTDLVLAAEVLFQTKLTSAERYRFHVWQHKMYNWDCSGWASFKTKSAADFAAVHLAVFEGWTHGIIGLIGRTGQRHFEEIEKLYYTCPLFRGRMAKPPTHSPEGHKLHAVGGGYIITLTADIGKLGQRLENESFHSATVEEVTRFNKTQVIDIVDSRARKPNPHAKYSCNKVIYLGSAETADSDIYRNRVMKAIEKVKSGNKRYSYTSLEVGLLKDIADCKLYINEDIYEEQKSVMSPTRFEQKWQGRFKSGIGDVYPPAIAEADSLFHTINDRASKDKTYILSYDVAMRTDRFAMKAIEISGNPGEAKIVKYGYSFRCPDVDSRAEYLAGKVYEDYDRFHPAGIEIDANGPGYWLVDAIYDYAQKHNREPLVVWNGSQEGRRLIWMFESSDPMLKIAIGRYDRDRNEFIVEGDDHLKNESHNRLREAFITGKLLFANDIHICEDSVVRNLPVPEYERLEGLQEAVLNNFAATKAQARDLQYEKDREGNIMPTQKGYYRIRGESDDDIQALVHCWVGVLIYESRNRVLDDEPDVESRFDCMAAEMDLNGEYLDALIPN